MKSQVCQSRTFSTSFLRNSQACRWFLIATLLFMLLAAFCQTSLAQENFLVVTEDGVLSLYDLATYSPIESIQGEPFTYTVTASPNQRLAFRTGGGAYGSAVDTSIGRAITSLTPVKGPSSTIGHSGKYYLVPDYSNVLDVVDTATLTLVRTVDLSSVITYNGLPGAITAANDQAYVLPRTQSSKVAVVNLTTFQLSSISLPAGSFCRRCAARVPDGSIVVVVENESSDHKTHVLLINTATNQIISDFAQSKNYGVSYVVVTPNGSGPLYGYVYSGGSVITLDLRPNSQTYGQILANTAVVIPNLSPSDMAINSDGSRVIVVGSPDVQPPAPNVAVVDTMNDVLAVQLTVNGGASASTVCTGFFSTTPPNGAPTVTGTSGDITNDKDNLVTITGTNFQPGALVRVGSLPQLPGNVSGSSTLTVTVPAGAPAGKAQDVIVTNPLPNMPPNQQNQSGLLAGGFNVSPNPAFHPTTQFATNNSFLLYLYDLKQQSLVNIPTGHLEDYTTAFTFNVDGKVLYLASEPIWENYYVLPINLSTNTPDAPISLPSNAYYFAQSQPLAAGRDPQKGTPVVYAFWFDPLDSYDLYLSKIDSDSTSKTYNTIIQTFNAGLGGSLSPFGYTITLTPDGKYAYVWYYTDSYYMGIFNLVTGAFTSIKARDLRVSEYQQQIGITPDGQSMLLSTFYGNRTRIKVFDISNPISPKSVAELTPIPIPKRGFPYVNNYQVVGNKLYAIDLSGVVVVFNFDRALGDFRERGYVASPSTESFANFAFSADGSYLYIVDFANNLVFVADTQKLATGGDPTVTNVRSPYSPFLLGVSPVPPPVKGATARRSGEQRRRAGGRESPQREKSSKIYSVQ